MRNVAAVEGRYRTLTLVCGSVTGDASSLGFFRVMKPGGEFPDIDVQLATDLPIQRRPPSSNHVLPDSELGPGLEPSDLLSELVSGTNNALSYTGIEPTVCSTLHSMTRLYRDAARPILVSLGSRVPLPLD